MKYYFSIQISQKDFYPYYQGKAQTIVVMSTAGQRVRFPAMHLRKFLTPTGINGRFCLETKDNKFLSLQRLLD